MKIENNFQRLFQFENLSDLLDFFSSEQKCVDYLEEILWNNKPVSPFDPTSKVWKCANNQYMCKNTGKRFNIKKGTIFENSKISLRNWFVSLFLLYSNKKGISSLQLPKYFKTTQKTSWFILHRLRDVCDTPLFKKMFGGDVEIDETYVGGSNSNRHWDKKVPHSQGRSWRDKIPFIVIIERGGNAIVEKVPNVEQKTLEPIIRTYIEEGSTIHTDEWKAYNGLKKWYNHEVVIHRKKQYVNGKASTNSAENFNSHLKRTIIGIYHWISKKHSQGYANEIAFRYNTRKWSEKDRFDLVLSLTTGKRLTYQQLIS